MTRTSIALFVAALAMPVGTTAARAPAGDIHAVDFKNFSYAETLCAPEGGSVTVKDGVFSRDDEDDRTYFKIREVVYGDLTGDGSDEAVVSTLCNTGGTGQFTDAAVYTMRGSKPVALGTLGVGDRADGGLVGVEVHDGVLFADRFGQDGSSGACCPQYVETYRFRWNGSALVETGKPTRRTYQEFQLDDSPAPHAVKFLRGTSSAMLAGFTTGSESYRLGARAGQKLTLRLTSDDPTASVQMTGPGGAALGVATGRAPMTVTLPTTGDVLIAVHSKKSGDDTDTQYRLDVVIA